MSHIAESSATLNKAGNRWKAVLITPGTGSSGSYTEEMLRATGPAAFPAGTHSYIDHKPLEQRSPRDLFGILAEDASYEDGVGLVGTLEVMPHFKEFAEAVGPHAGLSIYATANRTDDGVVEALIPDRTNSVDLVSYAGRGGALAEHLLESAREAFTKTSVTETDSGAAPADVRHHTGKKEISMEIDELATRVEKLSEGLTALADIIKPLAESVILAEQEKVAKAAKEAEESKAPELDFSLIAEAAIAAGLPKAAREVVYTEVRLGGASVEESIAKQKELVESIQKSVQESFGSTVRVGSDSVNQDFSVSRWGK